jgi:hypothetical protein
LKCGAGEKMEKFSWTDRVRKEEVLHRVKEERNILHTINRRKVNWIGHILHRNYLLEHVIEGKVEGRIDVTGRRGRRRKQILNDLKETTVYWKLEEAVPTSSHSVKKSLWKSLRTCRKRDYGINDEYAVRKSAAARLVESRVRIPLRA